MVYHNDIYDITAIVETVYVYPNRKAVNKQKGYRIIYKTNYNDDFIYRVVLFNKMEEVMTDLKLCGFNV